MNSLFFPSPFLPSPPFLPSFRQSLPHPPLLQLKPPYPPPPLHTDHSFSSPRTSISTHCTTSNTTEGPVSVLNFEDFIEKDWSFLDSQTPTTAPHNHRIISAGNIQETSKVLISIPSEEFVDRVVESVPKSDVLVVHDSLFFLAGIKEKYDKVKCWQGEIIYVPEKWGPFDAVFLYYLPGFPFDLSNVFGTIAGRCSPGARLIISHPQGREAVQQQRKEYPDVVVSDLPDKVTLEKVAADNSFDITEFVDEPRFYLAVLKYSKAGSSTE